MTGTPEWLTLEGEESVVWSGRPRTMSIAGTVLRALVRTAVLVAVGLGLMGTFSGALPAVVGDLLTVVPDRVPLGIVAVAVLWGVAQVVRAALVLTNVEFVLTDRNLYKKTGVLSETVQRVGLDRIQRTSLSKDLFGNLFDYGSVAVSTAGGSGVEMVIADLDDPDELRLELRRLVNEASGGGATGGGGGGADRASGVAAGNEALLRELVQEAAELNDRADAVREVLER